MPNQYEQQQAARERRRRLLEAMRAQAMTPDQTQIVSGRVVPYSPWQGLAKIAQSYMAGQGLKEADEEEQAQAKEYQGKKSESMQKVIEAMTRKPQQGGPLQYAQGQEYQQFTPEVKPDYKKAAIMAATDPYLQDNKGLQGVTEAMLRSEYNKPSAPSKKVIPGVSGIQVFDPSTNSLTYQPYEEGFTPAPYDVERKVDIAKGVTGAKTQTQQEIENLTREVGMPKMIEEARKVLETGEPTQSGIGTIADSLANFFGISLKGADAAGQLKVIGGALTSRVPRMEGPQSDYDAKTYREMAGQIGDSNIPTKQRLAALQTVADMWTKPPEMDYADYLAQQGRSMPGITKEKPGGKAQKPEGVPQEVWDEFTDEERAAFQ